MKCLVTGGAGFIGSHLVDRLIADGHEVYIWDDLSTGRMDQVNPCAHLTTLNVVDMNWLRRPSFDWIFHLAGRAELIPSIDQPTAYISTNVLGTARVFDHARRTGCKRFIYAASSSCYGANPWTPTDERAPIEPVHPYALSKWLGEEVVMHLGSLYRIPTMSLRLFNVYGPRGRTGGLYGAVMGTFLAQRAHGAPLTIVGDGTQRRDFVWVEDVADAFVRAAAVDCVGICNIGSGEATSVNRLAAMIGGPVVHIPARGGEPAITQTDPRKAKRQLGWMARTSLVEGIAHLLKDLTPWTVAPWTPETIAEATAAWHRHLG